MQEKKPCEVHVRLDFISLNLVGISWFKLENVSSSISYSIECVLLENCFRSKINVPFVEVGNFTLCIWILNSICLTHLCCKYWQDFLMDFSKSFVQEVQERVQ